MGSLLSRVLESFQYGDGGRMIMVGLDGAGKTTILYALKLGGERVTTIPTIGFNVETVTHKNISFTIWDVGGQHKIRTLWKHYYQNSNGILFVIDSTDRKRIGEAAEELEKMLLDDELRGVALLVLANKQDLPDPMSPAELTEALHLTRVACDRPWHIQAACAVSGDGIYEGLDWLAKTCASVHCMRPSLLGASFK